MLIIITIIMDKYEEEILNHSKASKLLSELKKVEKGMKFHTKRISNSTIVMCKNEDRIKMYEDSMRIG